MAKQILEIPEYLGNVISEAVLTVTDNPDEYDLWYHGSPIWLVHRERPAGKYTRVSRVQITPCMVDRRSILLVQPDVHLLIDSRENGKAMRRTRVAKSLKHSLSAGQSEEIELTKLFQDQSDAHLDWARQTIADMIRKVWASADSLADQNLQPASAKHLRTKE